MENATISSKTFEIKTNEYGKNMDNFVAESELTVTITLNEYRKLVSGIATKASDVEKANSDKYEREQKIKNLQEENAQLKAENYELKKQLEQAEEKEKEDF